MDLSPGVTRRQVLRLLLSGGAAVATTSVVAACGGGSTAAPPTARPATGSSPAPAAQAAAGGKAQVQLTFVEWGEDQRWMNAAVDEFNKENPEIKLTHQVEPSQSYEEKMVARFRSKVQTDVMTVRDNQFAEWAAAQFIQPIEGMSGLAELDQDTYPTNLDAMKYQGKQYGVVFYTDYMGFFYNPDLLKKGGFDNPPTTWDEAQQMAVALKGKQLAEFPFDFDLSKASNSSLMWLFWTTAFGDGGHIFDGNNDPLWPDKDPTYMKIVTFLADAVQKYKTLDPARIQPSSASIGPLDAGLAAFGIGASYGLPREQNTQYTKIPGVNKMTYAPSFHQTDNLPLGTVTWTRMYGMSSFTKDPETTWKAQYFLGGKDKTGDYWNSKNWLEHDFKFSGFKSFRESPFAQDIAKKWSDPTVTTKMAAASKAREALKEPWWSDWDVFNQGELQSAMLGKETPEGAAKASADEARRLKAKFKS